MVTKFPLQLKLRIDWSELDTFGHVNNVAFIKYIQASRINYWEKLGLIQLMDKERLGPMLASTQCQYKKPLFYPGNILVRVRMEFIKNTSFGMHHQILNDEKEIAAEANDVLVMFDFKKGKRIFLPEEMRNGIEKIEGRKF